MVRSCVIAIGLAVVSGCSTAPRTSDDKAALASGVQGAIGTFTSVNPALKDEMSKAAGYAVFPEIGKGGAIVGGAFGRGEVYDRGAFVGYCKLSQGTIGFQLGGQAFSELILFQTKAALDNFKSNEFTFSANATAVAVRPGAAAVTNYAEGVAVFVYIKGGLMAEASIGGQKISFEAATK